MTESANIDAVLEAIRRCCALRNDQRVEAVLRAEFHSRLRSMFPNTDDESWINHYAEGTEAHTKITAGQQLTFSRFVDNLIGATTIEYESDLRNNTKRDTGYGQVAEHASGLIRSGIPPSQISAILSDTVEWYAYTASLPAEIEPVDCRPEDVVLHLIESLDVSLADETAAIRLVHFIRKHLARQQSRPLLASNIVLDLGLESSLYSRCEQPLRSIVEDGRSTNPSITLATDLWAAFVDHLEGQAGEFRVQPYIDEIYVGFLARLISANALQGRAILGDQDELRSILNGDYFRNIYHLSNMVEQDYFGWLTTPDYIDRVLPIADEMQRDLYAYDFSGPFEQDLFGQLMAQLARRSERRLLGQEWTPQWLSRHLAVKCIDSLPAGTKPRFVDMCCGSGSIIAEVLKEAKDRFTGISFSELVECAAGFDIDPLAVTLAKTTWVTTLASDIRSASTDVVIPIYHADSLFAVTPVTAGIPFHSDTDEIDIDLDGVTVRIPIELMNPEHRDLFDRLIDWTYDEALEAKKTGDTPTFTSEQSQVLIDGITEALHIEISTEFRDRLTDAVLALANRMIELAVTDRNGIWAFILRNTYRPGLLSGQFNGLVSNPPWLAMSRLADNPYRGQLTRRAEIYGVKPSGSSHLHLELAAIHLLHAVDRYLCNGATVACLVPGTLFNATHFERFRSRHYLSSDRKVPLQVTEAWQLPHGTFKYPGAAVVGIKRDRATAVSLEPPRGYTVTAEGGPTQVDLSILELGDSRTAWVLAYEGDFVGLGESRNLPQQGADLMPRTTVCIDVQDSSGSEFRVDTPERDSPLGFVVKDSKQLKDSSFPGYVAPRFIYRMAQSVNLLPFTLGSHFAPIAIPATRDATGSWQIHSVAQIRSSGLIQTARRFGSINDALAGVGNGKDLQERINVRNKLSNQQFPEEGYLVLVGAGGQYVCAACIPLEGNQDIVIDQTLYWKVVSEQEAWFRVGALNSIAMTEAVRPFNPRGDFGERHVHTLPYRLLPSFQPTNELHADISRLGRELSKLAQTIVSGNDYLNNPHKSLSVRRRKLREALMPTEPFNQLEQSCATLLGTTAFTTPSD